MLATVGAIGVWRRLGASETTWHQAVGLGMFIVPTLGILGLCAYEQNIQIRYFSVVVPALALAVSLGIAQIKRPILAWLAVGAMVVLGSVGVTRWYGAEKEDWKGAIGAVERDAGPNDAIILFDPYRINLFDYYDADPRPAPSARLVYPEAGFEPFPLYRAERHMSPGEIAETAERFDRVWVLVSEADRPESVTRLERTLAKTHRRVAPSSSTRSDSSSGSASRLRTEAVSASGLWIGATRYHDPCVEDLDRRAVGPSFLVEGVELPDRRRGDHPEPGDGEDLGGRAPEESQGDQRDEDGQDRDEDEQRLQPVVVEPYGHHAADGTPEMGDSAWAERPMRRSRTSGRLRLRHSIAHPLAVHWGCVRGSACASSRLVGCGCATRSLTRLVQLGCVRGSACASSRLVGCGCAPRSLTRLVQLGCVRGSACASFSGARRG